MFGNINVPGKKVAPRVYQPRPFMGGVFCFWVFIQQQGARHFRKTIMSTFSLGENAIFGKSISKVPRT